MLEFKLGCYMLQGGAAGSGPLGRLSSPVREHMGLLAPSMQAWGLLACSGSVQASGSL